MIQPTKQVILPPPTGNAIVKVHKNWKNADTHKVFAEDDGKKVVDDTDKDPVSYDRIVLSQPKRNYWKP